MFNLLCSEHNLLRVTSFTSGVHSTIIQNFERARSRFFKSGNNLKLKINDTISEKNTEAQVLWNQQKYNFTLNRGCSLEHQTRHNFLHFLPHF